MEQQIADVSEPGVSTDRTRVRACGAHLVVNEFKVARRLIFPHSRVAMIRKSPASERYIHCFDLLRLLRSRVHKDLVPVNLQVGTNTEPLGPGREFSREIGDGGSHETCGET